MEMIKVIFYNLLRSKYGIEEAQVNPGSVGEIITQILEQFPQMKATDFETAVVFYQGKPIHKSGFHQEIEDGSKLIITHFVGGG